MKTDILYVLKREDGSDYEDLRLSLRSLDKNCFNVGRVFLAGAIPNWVNKGRVICMPLDDFYVRKHKNILEAMMYAVNHSDIGSGCPHGMFMYSSDDHFYIQPKTNMEWNVSPVWYCGNIHSTKDLKAKELKGENINGWLRSMVETRAMLQSDGHNCLMFSQHANTWFSSELMKESRFGKLVANAQKVTEYGCEPSCLMGNYMLTRHPEWIKRLCYREDVKISNAPMDSETLVGIIYSGRECISGSPYAANGAMIKKLRQMFHEKCRYEK